MSRATALYFCTEKQDIANLTYQRTTLQDYAEALAYGSLATYKDYGYPVTDPERPAFTRLEHDIRDGKVARVLIMSRCYLGRDTEEELQWARFLHEHGTELITMDTPKGYWRRHTGWIDHICLAPGIQPLFAKKIIAYCGWIYAVPCDILSR